MTISSRCSINSLRVFHACMTSLVGIMSGGFIEDYTSPIEDQILEEGFMTLTNFSLFTSSVFIGALAGSLVTGPVSEWLGSKTSTIIVSQLATLGGMLLVWAHDSTTMILGRILIGFYIAFVGSSLPIYNAEISPASTRGFYGSLIGISLRVGTMLSYLLGIWLGYRWLAAVYVIIVVIVNLNFVFLPESPKWLRKKGYTKRANLASSYFHDCSQEVSPLIQDEVYDTTSVIESPTLTQSIRSYFAWPIMRPLLVCISVQLFRSFSTHDYIQVYAAHTLHNVVVITPRAAALFYPVFLIIGSLVFIWIIHRVHWKKLIMVTTIIQILTNGMFSLVLYISNNRLDCAHNTQEITLCKLLQITPLLLIAIYGMSYSIGMGSIAWWLYGQILHPHYTRISTGVVTLVTFSCVSVNLIVGSLVAQYLGSHYLYLAYTVICIFALITQLFY